MQKANTSTTFTYGDTNFYYISDERYATVEVAMTACIESMKRRHAHGFTVTNQAIIRVDYVKIFDELMVISEQTTKTVIETVDKHYVEEGDENDI